MEIMNGKELSRQLEGDLQKQMSLIQSTQARLPLLVVVLVGEDPASLSYVAQKEKACARVGFLSKVHRHAETITQDELTQIIVSLNLDPEVDGILLQLPLPKHINSSALLQLIQPDKDVDGLNPINVAKLYANQKGFVPCTPKGIMTLLHAYHVELSGKKVVVLGRSALVGRPVAQLMLNQNATVTICHSKTQDIAHHTKDADVIVVAIGKALFLDQSFISKNQVIVDVGITRVEGKLVGDVDYEAIKEQCALITPVPGGVGPMTIVSLLENTLEAYQEHMKEITHARL